MCVYLTSSTRRLTLPRILTCDISFPRELRASPSSLAPKEGGQTRKPQSLRITSNLKKEKKKKKRNKRTVLTLDESRVAFEDSLIHSLLLLISSHILLLIPVLASKGRKGRSNGRDRRVRPLIASKSGDKTAEAPATASSPPSHELHDQRLMIRSCFCRSSPAVNHFREPGIRYTIQRPSVTRVTQRLLGEEEKIKAILSGHGMLTHTRKACISPQTLEQLLFFPF